MPLARIPLDRHGLSSSSLIPRSPKLSMPPRSLPILPRLTFFPPCRVRHPSLNPDGVIPRWLRESVPVILRKHTAGPRLKLPER